MILCYNYYLLWRTSHIPFRDMIKRSKRHFDLDKILIFKYIHQNFKHTNEFKIYTAIWYIIQHFSKILDIRLLFEDQSLGLRPWHSNYVLDISLISRTYPTTVWDRLTKRDGIITKTDREETLKMNQPVKYWKTPYSGF